MTNQVTSQASGNVPIPDLNAWLMSTFAKFSAGINCVQIGTIDSFDASTQTANVKINYLRVFKNANPNLPLPTNNPTDVTVSYPILVKCPVIVLNGGGAFLSFPIVQGDTCILLFNDREIDTWLSSGQITAPQNIRTHDLMDAICLVGIRAVTNVIPGYSSTDCVLSFLSGIINVIDSTGERLSQPGDLKATARSSAPSGWLLCFGQSISKLIYPTLFSAIGYTYGGSGDNFNVPDLRGRIPVGLDNMGGSNANVLTNAFTPNRNTLGGSIGEQTHILTVPEIPSHSHNILPTGAGNVPAGGSFLQGAANDDSYGFLETGLTGGDEAHYNVQPGRMFNWVIKI